MSQMHVGGAVTTALIDLLEDAGLLVGDGTAPATGGWTKNKGDFQGYVVLHALPGGVTDGSIDSPDEHAEPVYQVSGHGATRAQAELVADTARAALLTDPLVVSGRTVAQVSIDMLGGCRRLDDLQPPQWQSVERYRVLLVP